MRHVIHDWSDEEAIAILQSVRKAMGPKSRLLIRAVSVITFSFLYLIGLVEFADEFILQYLNEDPDKPAEDVVCLIVTSLLGGFQNEGVFCMQAPKPLLPNFGSGNIRLYNQDVNMLVMANSTERTFAEYTALG
jgi:hypothetical protein